MNIFETLAAGDSTAWTDYAVTLPDGRLADSSAWRLTYYLRGAGSLDAVAVASGSGWRVALTSTATAALAAGLYGWTAIVTNADDERITVGKGQLQITPDVTQQTPGIDPRTRAQAALAACEDAMATFNKTGGKVKKYTIAGRDMEFQTIGDLMSLRSFWAARVLAEGHADAIAQGLGNPRNLYARFNQVI